MTIGFFLSLIIGLPIKGLAAQGGPDRPLDQEGKARFELDTVVVTATREEDPIKKIPLNVTVITEDDIQQASSNNIVDLLSREANVNMRSLFGRDKNAGVDIRGMGDTFVSNVIVMVDGFRLNAPDLSGADLSSIPLDQVERIEIIRGPGSVMYGDGAVGGVINIITKKGKGKPALNLYTSYGTFGTFDSRASVGGQVKRFNFNINADYYSTDGYRDNGDFRKKDGAIQAGYNLGDRLRAGLKVSAHKDRYGLPGPVALEALDSRTDRRKTSAPKDFGETEDNMYMGFVELNLEQWGRIKVTGDYRHRNNPYVLGYTPLLSTEDQTDFIDERTDHLELNYSVKYNLWGREHRLILGSEFYNTDYLREDRKTSRKNSDVERSAWFASAEWALPAELFFSAGYRYSKFNGKFRTDTYQYFFNPVPPFNLLYSDWVPGTEETKIWRNKAYNLGLTWLADKNTSIFASYAKSFRNPNVDELSLAADDLRPQEGYHFDVGARKQFGDLLEASLTLFRIKMKDEIYYGEDPDTGMQFNRNYDDDTLRRGIEAEVKLYPTDFLYLWCNYSYTSAKFEEKDTYVPLVPKHQLTVGGEWNITDALLLSVVGSYVSSKYDGNDQDNDLYRKVDAYTVVDAKLSYRYQGLTFFAGVNNMFSKLYSTVAYSETYYPMPTRNYYAGASWRY